MSRTYTPSAGRQCDVRKGGTRTVFLIGPWAVKFPTWRNGSLYFVYGMLANRLEWDLWRHHRHPRLAPVLWCGPLGLVSVMRRYPTIIDRLLTRDEVALFPFVDLDNNGDNVAQAPDGTLILIDYGNPAMCCINDPTGEFSC